MPALHTSQISPQELVQLVLTLSEAEFVAFAEEAANKLHEHCKRFPRRQEKDLRKLAHALDEVVFTFSNE